MSHDGPLQGAHDGIAVVRLFVAGDAPNSQRARAHLRALLARHPEHPVTVEIVDVLRAPRRALEEGIIVTPTLVRVSPLPRRTLVGDLSRAPAVAAFLGLPEVADE